MAQLKAGKVVESSLSTAGGNVKLNAHSGRQVPYNLRIVVLDISSRELKP